MNDEWLEHDPYRTPGFRACLTRRMRAHRFRRRHGIYVRRVSDGRWFDTVAGWCALFLPIAALVALVLIAACTDAGTVVEDDTSPPATTTAATVLVVPDLHGPATVPPSATALRTDPPTTTTDPCADRGLGCLPFAPAELDSCARMVWYMGQWGLPDRFGDSGRHGRWVASDGLGWRESKCDNAAISPTGCCGGWWQLYIATFIAHGHRDALALCGVDDLADVVGINPPAEQRQACVTAWLWSIDGLSPWAPH